jgi:hypothetical protein
LSDNYGRVPGLLAQGALARRLREESRTSLREQFAKQTGTEHRILLPDNHGKNLGPLFESCLLFKLGPGTEYCCQTTTGTVSDSLQEQFAKQTGTEHRILCQITTGRISDLSKRAVCFSNWDQAQNTVARQPREQSRTSLREQFASQTGTEHRILCQTTTGRVPGHRA